MKYFWNDHTLEDYKNATKEDIESFVANNCQLEDGDTNKMLVDDLMQQINNKKS